MEIYQTYNNTKVKSRCKLLSLKGLSRSALRRTPHLAGLSAPAYLHAPETKLAPYMLLFNMKRGLLRVALLLASLAALNLLAAAQLHPTVPPGLVSPAVLLANQTGGPRVESVYVIRGLQDFLLDVGADDASLFI
jgi:hypothetical protein